MLFVGVLIIIIIGNICIFKLLGKINLLEFILFFK